MNLLFHHLPKTGGTSIRFWIARGLGPAMIEFGPQSRSGTLPEQVYRNRSFMAHWGTWHITVPGNPVCAVMGHYVSFPVVKRLGWDPETVVSVTVIRDPAERLFSQFKHFEHRQDSMCSFEEWIERDPEAVKRGKAMPRICHCLQCQFEGFSHQTEPMSHFYASRNAGELWRGLGTVAESVLRGMRVYSMGEIPRLVLDLAQDLKLNEYDFKSEHVSGFGAQVTKEQRRLVEKNHPMDAELYHWARRLKKKREPMEKTGRVT